MLAVLARNADKVVTYGAMARAVWGYEPESIDLNALRILASRVRQRLGTGPERPVIHNERAIGYRLAVLDQG
jgi:DNA-binding response OmpR family regulator